mmetsp:Transcript_25819/g.65510  ORF Transcript_25819/g.65510 Transcript_25819/m.65510 type:complete len:211 (+) Transcript_25819:125-757(+)
MHILTNAPQGRPPPQGEHPRAGSSFQLLGGGFAELSRRDAELDHHVGEFRQLDAAGSVRIVLFEERLDRLGIDGVVTPEVAVGADGRGARLLRVGLAHFEVATQAPRDLLDEVLGGEAVGAAQVARALPVDHGAMHRLPQHRRVVVHEGLVLRVQVGGVAHRPDEGLGHAERVEARLLAAQVRVPQVGDRPVARLELHDGHTVRALADQV